MNASELFERWFGRSIEKLRELPNGDGAFAALMIAIPLYERFIIASLKGSGSPTKEADIQKAVGDDLGLDDGQRRVFWEMFRNGFMHQAMAKDGKTKWMVSSEFGELPEFKTIGGVAYICLNPWKFADRVLRKFRSDPKLITASESFPLATIFQLPPNFVAGGG